MVLIINNTRNEFRMLKYDFLIFLRHSEFVTLSVLGEIVRLMPTEKITPATVYSVLLIESDTQKGVKAEMVPATTTENNKYATIFFILLQIYPQILPILGTILF